MKKSKMIKIIKDRLAKTFGDNNFNIMLAELILKEQEEAGLRPPCVDSDKCQFLMRKFIDPSFNYWDEDFDELYGEEFEEFARR